MNECPIFEFSKLGTELDAQEQEHVLRSYVHRYTRQHVPEWANQPRPDGGRYPVQFESDADWLANTHFKTTVAGTLDRRSRECYARATWPDNPELRK